jgi:protoporphyrinogen IX oxidase
MYLWIKALHVMADFAWMAGMFYLPRLFVYHADVPVGSPQSETFKIMERRLLTAIINPSMAVAWLTGLWLAYESEAYKQGWFHVKFALVILLSGVHGILVGKVRAFAEDRNVKSAKYYRVLNEIPTILLIGIIVMVIVRPF